MTYVRLHDVVLSDCDDLRPEPSTFKVVRANIPFIDDLSSLDPELSISVHNADIITLPCPFYDPNLDDCDLVFIPPVCLSILDEPTLACPDKK